MSQAEIDSLLNAINLGELNAESLREQNSQKVRLYDFRKPNKFSKEQISAFQVIYGNYARSLGTYLSLTLRAAFNVTLLSIEQVSYEEFIRSLLEPSFTTVFQMTPLEGTAIMEVSPELVFAILERLLGGRGIKTATQVRRALTEIEMAVMENVSQELLDLSIENWENIIRFNPKIERIETNPQFAQIVAPSEMVLLISMEASMGKESGVIQFCFPYIVLEPILDKFNTRNWFEATSRGSDPAGKREQLQRNLASTRLPVRVLLGGTTITMGELLDLKPGDVVLLDKKRDESIDVMIGNSRKFYGKPGIIGNKLAVRVVGVAEETVAGEKE